MLVRVGSFTDACPLTSWSKIPSHTRNGGLGRFLLQSAQQLAEIPHCFCHVDIAVLQFLALLQNFPQLGILLVFQMEFGEGGELNPRYKWNVSLVKETIPFGGLHKGELGVREPGFCQLLHNLLIHLSPLLHYSQQLYSIVGIQKCLVVLHSILRVPKASASPMTDIHQEQDTSLRQRADSSLLS